MTTKHTIPAVRSIRKDVLRLAAGILPSPGDPRSLAAFLASASPVRASLDIGFKDRSYVIETEDGQKYAFTLAEGIARFGSVEAFEMALAARKEAGSPAGRQNTAP